MKIVKKNEAQPWALNTASGCEYNFNHQNIDCAVVNVFGRFPQSGWCRNCLVDEMVFVKHGYAKIVFENCEKELFEDDAILIEKNEWYYWHQSTNATLVPVCNPAWSKEQVQEKPEVEL